MGVASHGPVAAVHPLLPNHAMAPRVTALHAVTALKAARAHAWRPDPTRADGATGAACGPEDRNRVAA